MTSEPSSNSDHVVPFGAARSRRRADWMMVACTARGLSIKETARLADVSKSTVKRRLRSPDFQQAVVRERARLHARNRGLLARARAKAVARLQELADSDDEATAVKAAGLLLRVTLPPKLAGELMADDINLAERLDEFAEMDRRERLLDDETDDDEESPPAGIKTVIVPAPPAPLAGPVPAAVPPAAPTATCQGEPALDKARRTVRSRGAEAPGGEP